MRSLIPRRQPRTLLLAAKLRQAVNQRPPRTRRHYRQIGNILLDLGWSARDAEFCSVKICIASGISKATNPTVYTAARGLFCIPHMGRHPDRSGGTRRSVHEQQWIRNSPPLRCQLKARSCVVKAWIGSRTRHQPVWRRSTGSSQGGKRRTPYEYAGTLRRRVELVGFANLAVG